MKKTTYRDALNPVQAKEMGRFLNALLWASDKAKDAGVTPNLVLFMQSWIGNPITAEGKRQRRNRQHREYSSRKKEVGR